MFTIYVDTFIYKNTKLPWSLRDLPCVCIKVARQNYQCGLPLVR